MIETAGAAQHEGRQSLFIRGIQSREQADHRQKTLHSDSRRSALLPFLPLNSHLWPLSQGSFRFCSMPQNQQAFFKKRLYLLKQFWVHSKTERQAQRAPTYPLSPHTHSLSHYHHLKRSKLITTDEPTLTQHYHPETMLYIRGHSSHRLSTPGVEYLLREKTGGAWLLVPNTLLNASAGESDNDQGWTTCSLLPHLCTTLGLIH